jgi:hypothetical protein
MSSRNSQPGFGSRSLQCLLMVSVAYFSPGQFVALAQQASPPAVAPAQPPAVTPPTEAAPKVPNDQLDSLVAPIALYPDPLLAQTLAASTYPLEIVLLQQWLEKNKNLKDKAFTDAVQKQTWDPSVQAMASLPEVVKKLADNISWTTDLGNAFLNQQSDVFDAVQRMRAKANSAGKLKSTPQMKVETKVVETKTVVVIEQADPKVVYVPTYNPTVIYGTSVYPYPPIYYPPATGAVLAFTAGVALGAAWNNGWGYNCGWGNNNVNVNVNNNYVNHYNKTNVNNVNRNNINNVKGSGNTWQHNAQHRGGVPYSNKSTAQKYGGTARTNSPANRPSNVSQRPSQQPALSDRSSASNRQKPAASDRSLNNAPSNRPQNRTSGNMDSIGNRQVSRDSAPRTNNAFSGPSSGANRSSAIASHDRGSRSMASSRSSSMRSGGGRRR